MPIYEYHCDKCKKIQEHLILNGDDEPQGCKCGGNLKRVLSRSSFHLKGSGWYVTDYKNKPSPKRKPNSNKEDKLS